MSRTDKDRPPWVRAKDEPNPFEWHYYRCEADHPYGFNWRATPLPCDIDTRHQSRCYRMPRYRSWRSGPPHWFRLARWYDPERNNLRMDCGQAIKEYRASGDVDVMPSIQQHHHSAAWDWD